MRRRRSRLRSRSLLVDASTCNAIVAYIPDAPAASEVMEVDSGKQSAAADVLPETEVYIRLLVLDYLIDKKQLAKAIELANSSPSRKRDRGQSGL